MTQRKQLPLLQKPNTGFGRGLTSNALTTVSSHLNGYFEVNTGTTDDSRKIAFCKRPGIFDFEYATTKTNLKTTNAAESITGLCTSLDKTQVIFFSQDSTHRYSNIYTLSSNTLTQTDITANFAPGEYALTVLDGTNYGSSVSYAATSNGGGALISSTGVWSKITDADFTGNGVKTNFVGIDGYLFYGVISGTNAGRIYASDLSAAAAATGWTALAYLSAIDVPGSIVWLSRIRNYLVCFKQYSIEFFENVGNPTPGSPLEARKQLTKKIGCASASSIQEVSDGIIFMGVDTNGKLGMYKLFQNTLEVKKISNSVVDTSLQNPYVNAGGFQLYSVDKQISGVRGQSQVVIFQNKELYITTLQSSTNVPMSYVYDNELDYWNHWATSFGADSSIDQTFVPSMCFLLNNTTGGYWTCFVNTYASKSRFSIFYPLDYTTTPNWFKDQYELATTNVHNYLFAWVSEMYDFGTNDRKFIHTLDVIYDADASYTFATAATVTSTMGLYILKGSYGNRSTFITRPINDVGNKKVRFNQLGSHSSVGFILYTDLNAPIRIFAIEVVYSGGPEYA